MMEGLLRFEFISYTVHLPLVLPLKPDSIEDIPPLNQQEAQKSACPQEMLSKGRCCFHTTGGNVWASVDCHQREVMGTPQGRRQ